MNCHICNSSNTRVLDSRYEVYFCRTCGHEFSALPPERQETYSPEYFREAHKKWFENPNAVLFQWIHTIVEATTRGNPSAASFLDVGCGQGDLLRYLRDAGSTVKLFGVDLVQNADERITYYRGDFVSFPFAERFDVISGLMVIEHVGGPHQFVRKISSILKPGGIVIMNTVNAGGFLYTLARVLRRAGLRGPFERLYDKHHLEHYRVASLRKLFELEGYRVIRIRTHNFPLRALDVPEGNALLARIYRIGIACVFFLTSHWGGVHETIIVQKDT